MIGAAARTAYRLNVNKTKFYRLAKSLFPEIGPMKASRFIKYPRSRDYALDFKSGEYYHHLFLLVCGGKARLGDDWHTYDEDGSRVSCWECKGELSSRVEVLGIVKKVAYLLAVAVAIVADWVVQTAAAEIGVDFGGFYFFGLLVTIWLVLNECISILENISEIGVPLPGFLLKLIEKLKKTVETTGDQRAD